MACALCVIGLYFDYRWVQWYKHRRVFGKIEPLKSMLGETPYPIFWARLWRWLRQICYLLVTCQCGILLHKLRVFCLPKSRPPAPAPPEQPEELEPYEPPDKSSSEEEEEHATQEVAVKEAEVEVKAGNYEVVAQPAFEHQEHEAAEYEADFG